MILLQGIAVRVEKLGVLVHAIVNPGEGVLGSPNHIVQTVSLGPLDSSLQIHISRIRIFGVNSYSHTLRHKYTQSHLPFKIGAPTKLNHLLM